VVGVQDEQHVQGVGDRRVDVVVGADPFGVAAQLLGSEELAVDE
jgi:hypothetical protein